MADQVARGRGRPRAVGRREELVAAAAPLFRRRGFANVGLRDVAAELGLGASAVYRHVSGKEELLDAAITSGLDLVEQTLTSPATTDVDTALGRLAEAALTRPDLWILLRRESLHLEPAVRRRHVARFAAVVADLGALVEAEDEARTSEQAELVARAALACLAAPSQYPAVGRDVTASAGLLHQASLRAVGAPLDGPTRLRAPEVSLPFRPDLSRRESVLQSAAEEFAARGYSATSLADVADRSGLSTATLYHYVESKSDLLVAVLERAGEWIDADRSRVMRSGAAAAPALEALLIDYIDLALSQTQIFRIFINDIVHVEADAVAPVAAAHLRYVRTWMILLASVTGLGEDEAWIRVSAALCVVNELVLSTRLRDDPATRSRLYSIARSVLGLPSET